MTPKNIIAELIARLRCYSHMWNDEDREVVEAAIGWMNRPGESGGWSPNPGGVCDNCGEPQFAHREDGECPDDGRCAQLKPALDRWQAIVEPAREKYRLRHEYAKGARRFAGKGKVTAAQVQTAVNDADAAWGDYQAAIRRADREAREIL